MALPQCQALGHLGMEERLIKAWGGALHVDPWERILGPRGPLRHRWK